MHELAIAQGICDTADEAAAGRRVCRIMVEIGAQCCVSPEALRFSFSLVAEGTAAEAAELEISQVAGDVLNVKSMEVEEMV